MHNFQFPFYLSNMLTKRFGPGQRLLPTLKEIVLASNTLMDGSRQLLIDPLYRMANLYTLHFIAKEIVYKSVIPEEKAISSPKRVVLATRKEMMPK